MNAKDFIKKGTGILVVVIMAVLMVNAVPSLGDVTEHFSVSTATEWQDEAGIDTTNIEYLTSSTFTDLEGFIAWNGTGTEGTWVSSDYEVTGEDTSVEFDYRAENDSDVTVRIIDVANPESTYETNLSATNGVNTQTIRTPMDNETSPLYRVEFELSQEDAEVYFAQAQGEAGNLSKTMAGFIIPLLLLGVLAGAVYEMTNK